MVFSKAFAAWVVAAVAMAASAAAQGKAGTMQIVGNSGVSAQMMFLQSDGQVMILDKVENNPIQVDGHPAWAVSYNTNTNKIKPLSMRSNTFCAGGGVLGDGRWIVTGGNKAVAAGGVDARPGARPYGSYNGGKAVRFLSPCSGDGCNWTDNDSDQMIKERWYPTVEPMRDGHVMLLGGMRNGGFVPTAGSNEASYEFYPSTGTTYQMDLLRRTVPLSLYPITYLMSDNRVFVQANKQNILWNTDTLKEEALPNSDIPRVYPASGGSAMLPLTPARNYLETIIMCGGMSLGSAANWGNEVGPNVALTTKAASSSCQTISPLGAKTWRNTDALPEGRSMGQFINLPDGTLWFGNGVKNGVAGYTTDPNSPGKPVGASFGTNPSFKPLVYNPSAPAGQRWKQVGTANVGRLYHSSATLLPDSSILVSGSNPNPDYTTKKWKTEYTVERWYPEYYDRPRPSNAGLPNSFTYGGNGFSLRFGSNAEAAKAKVVIIRTGFSTHAMNMGQRMLELRSTVTGSTLNVAQMPPNPALFAPGPALAFVVVNGVPSQGKFIMVGNGRIGNQPIQPETVLPSATANQRLANLPSEDQAVTPASKNNDAANAAALAMQGSPAEGSPFEELLSAGQKILQAVVDQVAQEFKSGKNKGQHLAGRSVMEGHDRKMVHVARRHQAERE